MKRIRTFAFAAVGLLAAAGVLAQQQRPNPPEGREGGGKMENCREMMKDRGMMSGMMGGGGMMGGARPNEQWRKPEAGK
jgi:hypothetical protein